MRPGYEEGLGRLVELIAHGKRIVGSYSTDKGFTDSSLPEHELKAWVVSATAAVERLAGRDSEYFRQLPPPMRERRYLQCAAEVPQAIQGVLIALGEAINNGHFEPVAAPPTTPRTPLAEAISRVRGIRERLLAGTSSGAIGKMDYDRLEYVLDSELPKLIGADHPLLAAMGRATFRLMAPNQPTERLLAAVLQQQAELLSELCAQLERDGFPSARAAPELGALQQVERLVHRFHAIVLELRIRHARRPTLEITDEYDVQNLFRGLLRVFFDDVRPEEWTPSYAGGASRMDFLLKDESLAIELKKTRDGLDAKKIGDELLVDIARYRATHPDCKTLVCFVYDPEHRIRNPAGLERDLSRIDAAGAVRMIIAPKL